MTDPEIQPDNVPASSSSVVAVRWQYGPQPSFYYFVRRLLKIVFAPLYRWEVHGYEHVPIERTVSSELGLDTIEAKPVPMIIAPNHSSMLDVFAVGLVMPRPQTWMGKAPVMKHRLLAAIFRRLGAIPVLRKQDLERQHEFREAHDPEVALVLMEPHLEAGYAAVIFPGGTRRHGGEKGEIKTGAARLALKTGVIILPYGIAGIDKGELRRRSVWPPFRRRVVCHIGEPIDPAHFRHHADPVRALTATLGESLEACRLAAYEQLQG